MYRCSCNRDRGVRIFIIALIIIGALGYFVYTKYVHDHTSDGDWVVVEEATCTEPGLRAKYCKICEDQYVTEVIPAAHAPADAITENYVDADCVHEGSYDEVVKCSVCRAEIERNTVTIKAKGHTPASPIKDNVVDSTHTASGSYDLVTNCSKCDALISSKPETIDPVGHTYEWTLNLDDVSGKFYAVGKCSCDESGNEVTLHEGDANITVAPANGNGCRCCATEYTATVTFDGKTKICSITISKPLDTHKVVVYVDGNRTVKPLSELAKFDSVEGVYYDLDKNVGIDHYKNADYNNEWNENGFAFGTFKCVTCEEWIVVRIYSAEHDTRLQNP